MDDDINADKAWIRDLEFVSKYGSPVAPRGLACQEMVGFQSVIAMVHPIIHNPLRKLGYKFMAAEAAWILSGLNTVKAIQPYSKEIAKFSDDGIRFFGAYGPPIRFQFGYVLEAIKQDEDTRQAVLTIWRKNPPASKDIPCTVALQWLIRNEKIHCIATMRSSDLWLGHPYDIFNFSAVSFAILIELNRERVEDGLQPLKLGNLFLTAGSKHIYAKNQAAVNEIIEEFGFAGPRSRELRTMIPSPFQIERYSDFHEFVEHLWQAAEMSNGALYLTGTN